MAQTGLITIQQGIYISGRMFKPNQQFNFIDIVPQLVGCGCGGAAKKLVKHYKLLIEGKFYLIPENVAVLTVVPIAPRDQNFDNVLYREFKQDLDHHDYKDINNNCIDCNELVPHGDLNNDLNTGGSPRKLFPETETASPDTSSCK